MRVSSHLLSLTNGAFLIGVGLYLFSISFAYFLDPIGLATLRSINDFVQSSLLGPFVVLTCCLNIAVWLISGRTPSISKAICVVAIVACVGLIGFYITRYAPFLISPYHDASPEGIRRARSFGYGIHLLALRTIPFAGGIIAILFGTRSVFRWLCRDKAHHEEVGDGAAE